MVALTHPTIRRATAADLPAILAVVEAAFGQPDEATLVATLRERGQARHELVAEVDGAIAGHVVASPMTFDPPRSDLDCLGIAPLSVAPAHQRQGIGSALMRAHIDAARAAGVDALFLLGSTDYYPRFGFGPSPLDSEYGHTDHFQSLELRPGCIEGVAGSVHYVDAFEDVR